jgi:hypothetical protein
MRSGKQINKPLLNMEANELTISDPLPNTIPKSDNLICPPANNGGSMEKFSVSIPFNYPPHSRLESPKLLF